jgi:AmmeMemoRadiSam system protein B
MLPRLRMDLDFMPSPLPDKPGLLIRDPFRFSDANIIVPPPLIQCLEHFDGEHSSLDLRAELVRITGQLDVSDIERSLCDSLSHAGFLEDDNFAKMRQAAERNFAESEKREPAHAGFGYPDQAEELREVIAHYLNGGTGGAGSKVTSVASELGESEPAASGLVTQGPLQQRAGGRRVRAIAAPHVSPFGGVEAYRAAYSALSPEDAGRTFVILGTSHYGHPDRLGLTRKSFVTPYGETLTDPALVDRLSRELGPAALMEDYCHAVEHSIEFQVVFLQHLFGPRIRVVPVLCGAYARSIYQGGAPEKDDNVRRIMGALGEMAARENGRLLWVLGIDMAHMGRRYGDRSAMIAGQGEMLAVAERDRARIGRIESGDAQGFWERVQENQDDLKWCGSSPVYTFLRAVPDARGELLHYQQWNIDEQSVVSFAGMRFH